MNWTRRNFIGNLIASAAGFTILKSATTYSRIWVPDKTLVLAQVGSIWNTHFVSTDIPQNVPTHKGTWGEVLKWRGGLWYKTQLQWLPLQPHSRPLGLPPDREQIKYEHYQKNHWLNEDETAVISEAMLNHPKVPIPELSNNHVYCLDNPDDKTFHHETETVEQGDFVHDESIKSRDLVFKIREMMAY